MVFLSLEKHLCYFVFLCLSVETSTESHAVPQMKNVSFCLFVLSCSFFNNIPQNWIIIMIYVFNLCLLV